MKPARLLDNNTSTIKNWKYILLWDAFLVDDVLGIEIRLLQWNIIMKCYWNKKDGRFSFEIQLKIEFLLANNSSKKCLEKPVIHFHINSTSLIRLIKQNQQATSCPNLHECLVYQIQFQKPILVVATDQMPGHTYSKE